MFLDQSLTTNNNTCKPMFVTSKIERKREVFKEIVVPDT